jgi:hypothetical protein
MNNFVSAETMKTAISVFLAFDGGELISPPSTAPVALHFEKQILHFVQDDNSKQESF